MHERLGIAGSGAIASGLAAVAIARGVDVKLLARSPESAERCQAAAIKQAGKLGAEDPQLTVTSDLNDLADRTFLVEAIVEETEPKGELLRKLASVVGEDAILSTTTSSLSVTELGELSGRPARFCGLHVFNPVPRMALVELVFADAADGETRQRAAALCEALGKTAVVVPDTPGFVVNALLFPYLFSAVDLQDKTGLASEDIDESMKLGAGHPIGPLALIDLVGLDVSIAIADQIGTPVPQRVRDMAAAGDLGRKTKKGFYAY